jgi:hypothetical protein
MNKANAGLCLLRGLQELPRWSKWAVVIGSHPLRGKKIRNANAQQGGHA